MTLCFYINTLNGTGGTERATVLLANYLADQGIDVYILCKWGGTKSFYLVNGNVKVNYLYEDAEINIYKKYPQTLFRYNSFINRIKPAYIVDIGVNLGLETIPLTFFKSTKVISWEHFNAKVYHNYFINTVSKWLVSFFSDRLIVLTEQDKQVYERKFLVKKISVIPYAVAINVSGYTYNENSKYVLTIGRLANQKGIDLLLEAWKLVNDKIPDWKLRIVGTGDLKDDLVRQCQSLGLQGTVEFIPSSLDVIQHFQNSSIYAMSSRYEGLPLVLIEAKCFGLPIVSFDCETGPRQIVRHNIDGILVEPEKPELLAKGIIELIESPEKRKKFNENALVDAHRFSPQVFFDKWIAVLYSKL